MIGPSIGHDQIGVRQDGRGADRQRAFDERVRDARSSGALPPTGGVGGFASVNPSTFGGAAPEDQGARQARELAATLDECRCPPDGPCVCGKRAGRGDGARLSPSQRARQRADEAFRAAREGRSPRRVDAADAPGAQRRPDVREPEDEVEDGELRVEEGGFVRVYAVCRKDGADGAGSSRPSPSEIQRARADAAFHRARGER